MESISTHWKWSWPLRRLTAKMGNQYHVSSMTTAILLRLANVSMFCQINGNLTTDASRGTDDDSDWLKGRHDDRALTIPWMMR